MVQLVRDDEAFLEPLGPKTVRPGDVFAVRTSRETLVELLAVDGLSLSGERVDDAGLERAEDERNLVEVVVAPGSELAGESLAATNFRQRYDATVLAVRRGGDVVRRRMARIPLRVGDTLLVEAPADSITRLDRTRQFIVAREVDRPDDRRSKTPVAVGIVLSVVAFAGLGVFDILTSALAGALAMVVTGCLRPPEVYEAIQWDVIFLLAGVIPLGLAMDATGAAGLVAESLVQVGAVVPPIVVVGLFYVVTALLTNVVSNNAAVVLMIPVALRAAAQLGASPRAYVFAVAFAASTAFMTPIGYQTNLFVYGPGGYRFSDYFRVGAPLQAIMAVVTTLGIAAIWGVWICWLGNCMTTRERQRVEWESPRPGSVSLCRSSAGRDWSGPPHCGKHDEASIATRERSERVRSVLKIAAGDVGIQQISDLRDNESRDSSVARAFWLSSPSRSVVVVAHPHAGRVRGATLRTVSLSC